MISKRKAIIGALLIFILTTILNFTVGSFITSPLGFGYAVPKGEYKQYEKFLALKDYLQKNYYKELDEEKLIEGAIKGMFDSIGDPYTQYMDHKEFSDSMARIKGTYGGIGVIVTPGDDGYVTVVSPIEDTPGEKAGLITGDKIVAVNGEAISGDKLDYAVELMKGKAGTEVTLTILRDGKDKTFDVNIKREEIRLKTVRSEVIENDIGYIRITMFDEQTAQDFKTHLDGLKKQNVKGIVLDLRNNPGGSLDQCVEIADIILGEQVIVYTEDRNGNREVKKSDKKQLELPLTVLVNKGSASASEILSGAIKDGNKGKIIGTTTFGKGLVQQVKPLSDGSGFKFTISEYFTPNGTNIHGIGVEPDIVVELPDEDETETTVEFQEDTQLKKAIEVLRSEIKK
ncbi:S41 family peptidase [Alkaliphilus sp. B6464]|uniref:S41 family peptidase n=1 Tax=Alkaliphilus sp. B6464 TaxID=2731219 RepID=UPI001BA6F6BA|nr:S41 family peptidase [Alkaliphilus sp. B6464]QUH18728.1 S41 family peptidase [Alkaliphilus sp. B6464]